MCADVPNTFSPEQAGRDMQRREILKWMSRGLAVATTAIVGIPGARYLFGTMQPRGAMGGSHQRVARLADLRPRVPLQVAVTGQRQDAWTTHDHEVIGRVWLVRRDDGESADPSTAQVAAFTTVCPHMGCQIQLHAGQGNFVCPCHRAAFGIDGAPLQDKQRRERNHAPRGMDGLACRVVQDGENGEWWVEVKYERFEPGLTHQVAIA
jgi:Rieske Fe-S protein